MQKILTAIIKISGRDLTVKENMSISTLSLKKNIGENFVLPVIIGFDHNNNIIHQKFTANCIVENNYKDKKVQSFKMKNRTRTRRLKGFRAHATQFKVLTFETEGQK
jgi:ribosomal protein L21